MCLKCQVKDHVLIDTGNIPGKILRHFLEPGDCVCEVVVFPYDARVRTARRHTGCEIGTIQITPKAVIKFALLDDNFQLGIICPCESEKAGQEIFSTFQHAVLGSGARNDFSAWIVKMPVLIIM